MLSFHILGQVLQLPPNILDLAPWLILPGFLGLAAPYIVRVFFPNADPVFAQRAKFVVYILIGLVSYGLGLIPPEQLSKLQPAYAIFASVVAAFFAQEVLYQGIQHVASRIMLGRDAYHQMQVNAQFDWKAASAPKPKLQLGAHG